MNFRDYVQSAIVEDDSEVVKDKEKELEDYTLEELKILLQHHKADAEECKDSDETAYTAALKDIAEIEDAIAEKEEEEED